MNKQDILIDLLRTPSPSGRETAIIDKVETYLKDFVDEVKRDAYGNLIAFKRGTSSKKLMLSAHADEVGMMITYIDNNGFIYFQEIVVSIQIFCQGRRWRYIIIRALCMELSAKNLFICKIEMLRLKIMMQRIYGLILLLKTRLMRRKESKLVIISLIRLNLYA